MNHKPHQGSTLGFNSAAGGLGHRVRVRGVPQKPSGDARAHWAGARWSRPPAPAATRAQNARWPRRNNRKRAAHVLRQGLLTGWTTRPTAPIRCPGRYRPRPSPQPPACWPAPATPWARARPRASRPTGRAPQHAKKQQKTGSRQGPVGQCLCMPWPASCFIWPGAAPSAFTGA